MDILFDINGEKGPNYPGRDVFRFRIQQYDNSNDNIHFVKVCFGFCSYSLTSTYDRNNSIKYCKQGYFDNCSKLIQNDGWEIKDDYPIRL